MRIAAMSSYLPTNLINLTVISKLVGLPSPLGFGTHGIFGLNFAADTETVF